MARLILTNNENKYQKAINRNIDAGFSDYAQYNNGEIFVSTHKKRIVKTDNYMEFPGSDFVAVVGTCIYNNNLGMEALREIYNDFCGDIEAIRYKALGNYLVAIKKNGMVTVFLDKYQTLKTYYYNIKSEWFITNSLADIGFVLDDKSINEFAFMQETMHIGALGIQSMFEHAYQLYGHQFIEINTESYEFTVHNIPYHREHRNFHGRDIESIVDEYADMVKKRFTIVANIFGDNIRIHQTGGLDNRTVFAGFMNVGCKPKIMYGVGNSVITNTKHEDLLANELYAKIFNLDFYQLDWKYDYLNGFNDWESLFSRYGFYYAIYGGNKPFFEEYEGKIPNYPRFMECGYFGENLRLREWVVTQNKNVLSIDEFIDGYQLGAAYGNYTANSDFYPNAYRFRNHLKGLFIEYSRLYGMEIEDGISIDQFDEFRHLQSRFADSIMVNLLNDFAPSIAMFSVYDLHEFPFDVPAEYRKNARFQLMLINRLYPDVMEVPVFTHCRMHDFNSATFSLKPHYNFTGLVAHNLKKLGENNFMYKIARNIYRTFKSSKDYFSESKLLKDYLIRIINEDTKYTESFIVPEKFSGSVDYLMLYAQYLHGIKLLKSNC